MTDFSGSAYTAQNEGGFRARSYLDSEKIWTVGTGCSGPDPFNSPDPMIGPHTIWTPEQGALEFGRRYRAAAAQAALDLGAAYWSALDLVRQAVLTDIAYQDGGGNARTDIGGLAGFHGLLAAVRAKNWVRAQAECLDSKNFTQSHSRCVRNGIMLLTGNPPAPF